jgi:hypothetical protein
MGRKAKALHFWKAQFRDAITEGVIWLLSLPFRVVGVRTPRYLQEVPETHPCRFQTYYTGIIREPGCFKAGDSGRQTYNKSGKL